MDEQQVLEPRRWIDARRAVRAIDARGGWTPALTASGMQSGIVHLTPDGRAVALTELLQGVCMTHRLTAGEVAGGFLLLDPDLTVFEAPVAVGVRTTCGAAVTLETVATAGPPGPRRPEATSPRVALGPPDWLDGFCAGDLVDVQLVDDTLILGPIDQDPGPADAPRHLVDAVRSSAAGSMDCASPRVAQLLAVLVEVGEAHPDLLDARSDLPVADLLSASGLRHAHGWLADDDAIDLDRLIGVESAPRPWLAGDPAPLPATRLIGAIARHRIGVDDPYAGHRREVLTALDDPGAVLLTASAAARSEGVPRLVGDLGQRASRARQAALQQLAAAHHLAHGRVQAGIDALERSISLADRTTARTRLAELRWICGDHRAAAALDPTRAESAAQARAHGASWEIEALLDALPSYEDPGADPIARARQLWRRARWYAATTGGDDLHRAQQRALQRHGDVRFPPEALADNLLEQFGGLARFAAEVGPLLTTAEQDLLRRWLARRRRWWRVREVEGSVIGLDRLDGGRGTDATGPWRAEDVDDPGLLCGDVACALVLPTGDPAHRILGGPMFSVDEASPHLPAADDLIGVVAMMTTPHRRDVWPDQLAA